MSKKTDKPTSARGHVEDNVIRWRLKQELIRLDSNGKPIKGSFPVNTFDRNWLSQQLFNSGGFMPPVVHSPPNPPDNVTSINKNRKPDKPVASAGNEAEKMPDPPAKRRTMDLSFLHDKAMAVDEFRHWSRISKEIGRKCSVVWQKKGNGKLSSPDLEAQRERSRNGHKGLKRLKFKSPPSTIHNPMVSGKPVSWYNQRLRNEVKFKPTVARFNSKGYAPSGKPISDFTVGAFQTIKNPVVYTNKWPFYKQADALPGAKPSSTTSPPTASKHWHGKAANDSTPAVRKMPDKDSLVFKMNAEVQWFINHVEPQNWPQRVHNLATWRSGGPIPNTGAINKAAADPATRERLINALYQGLLEDWKMLDSALTMSNKEVRRLNESLRAEEQERMSLEWQLAASTGDYMSADEISREMQNNVVKSKTPEVPDDADVMLAQFNVYQSFVRCDGPEHAFARYVYGDPRLGEVIREHADMRANERVRHYEEREALRRIGSNMAKRRAESGYIKWPEIRRFREHLKLRRLKSKVSVGMTAAAERWENICQNKRSIYYRRLVLQRKARDITLIQHWGKPVTPFNRKKPVNYQQVINDVVGVRSVEYSKPSLVDHYDSLGFKHKKYMNTSVAKFYLQQTWKGSFTRGVNRVIDFFNQELNPIKRGDMAREREELRKKRILSRKEKDKRKAENLEKIAKGNLSVKHAEQKLHARGFVIVDK